MRLGSPRLVVAGAFAALALVAAVWLALDRRPPEWDHANHLERALLCARDLGRGDLAAVLERSSFYPPLVPCAAGLLDRLAPSDAATAQSVVLAFLGLGMAAVYVLARDLGGGAAGAVAAVAFGTAPFVVFSMLRFQLDLPLAAMVALALVALGRAENFARPGWSLAAGLLVGLGLLTKPTFPLYVAVPVVGAAARVRRGREVASLALAALVAALVALPWYGPRLMGLAQQVGARAFAQAAESGYPGALTVEALALYPRWFVPQFGVVATALAAVGLLVALGRRWILLVASLLLPLLPLLLVQNKNLRYTLPLLPLAAVLAGLGFAVLRRPAQLVAGALLAAAALVHVGATAFGVPSLPALPWGPPLVFASPPAQAPWPHREILALIVRDARGPATVSVVPNDNFFSVSNFRYYGVRDGLDLAFVRAWDREPLGVEYMILKTGHQGPEWTAARPRRIADRLARDPHLARAFPILGTFPLPDGSTATVRARRLGEGVAAPPADVAARLQAALRRALPAVAREVDGLEVTVTHDDAIRRGRVARVVLAARRADVAEYARRGAAVLEVRDVRLAVEGLLVNPWSLAAEGRLDLLDADRVRLEAATIPAQALGDFLAELRHFRRARVSLEPGALAFRLVLPGPDVTGRVRLVPAADRPFALAAGDVRVGGVPVPDRLVQWVLRAFDPTPRLASRLPVPVAVGRIDIGPDAIRVSTAR